MTTSTITPMKANSDLKFHSSGLGYTVLTQLIQQQLDRLSVDEYYPLKELFDDYCIYGAGGKLFKRGFTVKADTQEVMLSDTTIEVVERTTYKPSDVTQSASKSYSKVMPMAAHGYPGESRHKQVPTTIQTSAETPQNVSQLIIQRLETKDIQRGTSEVANDIRPMHALGIEYPGDK